MTADKVVVVRINAALSNDSLTPIVLAMIVAAKSPIEAMIVALLICLSCRKRKRMSMKRNSATEFGVRICGRKRYPKRKKNIVLMPPRKQTINTFISSSLSFFIGSLRYYLYNALVILDPICYCKYIEELKEN